MCAWQAEGMTTKELTRDIELEVAFNVRHMGGYRTADGRRTTESIIRGASLHRLTERGVGALRDEGVTAVVDLRSGVERRDTATPDLGFAGIRMVAAPVFEQDGSPVGMREAFPGYATVYQRLLDIGRTAYRRLFETIAETDGRVLFHCAAGKDRTGVGAVLLLSLAGAGADDIVRDYSVSRERLAGAMPFFEKNMRERGGDVSKLAALMASNPEDLRATLVHLDERWGGADGYLAEIGVSEAVRGEVRAKLVG